MILSIEPLNEVKEKQNMPDLHVDCEISPNTAWSWLIAYRVRITDQNR